MSKSSKLYNKDLAPTPASEKKWGWFEIFNVWANDVQSLFGYTLAASLFLASGLNGWAVMLALVLAGFFIMWLVNLSPSQQRLSELFSSWASKRFKMTVSQNYTFAWPHCQLSYSPFATSPENSLARRLNNRRNSVA